MNAGDVPERSSRVEREIAEILERADSQRTRADTLQAAVLRQRASVRSRVARTPALGSLPIRSSPALVRIIAALVLAVAAAFVSDASRLLAVLFALASAATLFSLWIPPRGSGLGNGPTRWRGRDLRGDSPSFGGEPDAPRPWRKPKRPF